MVDACLRCIECFIAFEATRPSPSSTQHFVKWFAVISYRKNVESKFEVRGRTEVVEGGTRLNFCSSTLVTYDPDEEYSSSVCVELYQSNDAGPGKSQSEALVGRVVSQMSLLLAASDMHFSANMMHPLRDTELVGELKVMFEYVTGVQEEELVEIELAVSALKRREWPKHNLGQSFEILRAHVHDDANNRFIWLPVFRSNRATIQKADMPTIMFPRVMLTKRHLCNGDEERRLRILLQVWDRSSKKSGSLRCRGLGYIDFTLRDLCEVDPTKDLFEIEADLEINHDEDWLSMGFASIEKAEPTELGSIFSLLIHHESTAKFISSSPKQSQSRSWKRGKRSRGKPGVKHIDSSSSLQGPASPPNILFSPLSYQAANPCSGLPWSEISPRHALSLFDDDMSPNISPVKSDKLCSSADQDKDSRMHI
jgi:hypothetical protein